MKLLLDENLSRRILPFIQTAYPGSTHVALEGLEQADDASIWTFAHTHDLVVVSRDSDFHERSVLANGPPRVIWLRLRNPTKAACIAAAAEPAAGDRSRVQTR